MTPLRILAVCDDPPVDGLPTSAGHTLISDAVLRRLAPQAEVTLVYFADSDDGAERLPRELVATRRLELRRAAPRPWLPRAVEVRSAQTARRLVARLSQAADVTYLHGLGSFGLASAVHGPAVANAVDPFSLHWRDTARRSSGRRAVLDRIRAERAERAERLGSAHVDEMIVVNPDDAVVFGELLGRPVLAVPNGVRAFDPGAGAVREAPPTLTFVGGLDYAPNIDSAVTLCREVLPVVRRSVPDVRVLIAGRRPVAAVTALGELPGVDVLADVPDVMTLLSASTLGAFPSGSGRGTRNSVLETLRAGTPVVADTVSARGIPRGEHLRVADGSDAFAAAVVDLLTAPAALLQARQAAVAAGAALPSWDQTAQRYLEILEDVAGRRR